jgi:hypothetical protein
MSDKELSQFEVVQWLCDQRSKRRPLKGLRPAGFGFATLNRTLPSIEDFQELPSAGRDGNDRL